MKHRKKQPKKSPNVPHGVVVGKVGVVLVCDGCGRPRSVHEVVTRHRCFQCGSDRFLRGAQVIG